MNRPSYYQDTNKKDLFQYFEDGLIPKEQVRGFYKANVIKYLTRYPDKGGIKDLEKAITYLTELKLFEEKQTVAKQKRC